MLKRKSELKAKQRSRWGLVEKNNLQEPNPFDQPLNTTTNDIEDILYTKYFYFYRKKNYNHQNLTLNNHEGIKKVNHAIC